METPDSNPWLADCEVGVLQSQRLIVEHFQEKPTGTSTNALALASAILLAHAGTMPAGPERDLVHQSAQRAAVQVAYLAGWNDRELAAVPDAP